MHNDEPDKLVVTKRNAPLLIGVGENEYYVASDVPAIIKHTKKAIYLADNQVGTLTPLQLNLKIKMEMRLRLK